MSISNIDEFKNLFRELSESPQFGIFEARKICKHDWRTWVLSLTGRFRSEVEEFFYFAEGFIEGIDEGFVNDSKTAHDLHLKAKEIFKTLSGPS